MCWVYSLKTLYSEICIWKVCICIWYMYIIYISVYIKSRRAFMTSFCLLFKSDIHLWWYPLLDFLIQELKKFKCYIILSLLKCVHNLCEVHDFSFLFGYNKNALYTTFSVAYNASLYSAYIQKKIIFAIITGTMYNYVMLNNFCIYLLFLYLD